MTKKGDKFNCFDAFDDTSPRKKEPTIQVLYDYEKHYMELVKKHTSEIKFIDDMLKDFRQEQEKFYKETLVQISEKLRSDEIIDNEMIEILLDRLATNMDRSFSLSENLIKDYYIKHMDEFHKMIEEKIKTL